MRAKKGAEEENWAGWEKDRPSSEREEVSTLPVAFESVLSVL
jgi:hypothetical protein